MKQRCKNLVEKIKRKREAHTPKTKDNSPGENDVDNNGAKQEADAMKDPQGINNLPSCSDSSTKSFEGSRDEADKSNGDEKDEIELLEVQVRK